MMADVNIIININIIIKNIKRANDIIIENIMVIILIMESYVIPMMGVVPIMGNYVIPMGFFLGINLYFVV